MKALIAGNEANSLDRMLGSNISLPVLVTDDDGVPEDLATAVVTAEFIVGVDRTTAPAKTITLTARANRGFTDITIAAGETTLTRGSYYVWIKTVAGGVTKIAASPSILTLR